MSFSRTITVRVARPGGPVFATREQWLLCATESIQPLFTEKGIALPEVVRIACGFPRWSRGASHAIGQCWPHRASGDGASEIFISPALDDPIKVAEVLIHELIHAADDCRSGHRGPFRKMAVAVGLNGPMRATHAGPELRERLNALSARLGPYPHSRLDAHQNPGKQSTRLVKVVCNRPSHGYSLWTTRMWLDEGTPTCPCGSRMSQIARTR
jgi:hypothetical protein